MRSKVVPAICIVFGLVFSCMAAAEEPQQGDLFFSRYTAFREEQASEVSLKSVDELTKSQNIFYLSVDAAGWKALDAALDDYFHKLAAEGFQQERLERLAEELEEYNVYLGDCKPIGYYSLWSHRVHVDVKLFHEGANAIFTKSVIFHEKVHENQIDRLDRRLLSYDQKQLYWEKLQEIAAHYNQIKYVLDLGDKDALRKVLENSFREKMFPNLLRYYPVSDRVIQVIRKYREHPANANT